jgi:hypothetical protein
MAQAIANKTEAAYRRGDMVAKRQRLMQAWADFIEKGQRSNVACGPWSIQNFPVLLSALAETRIGTNVNGRL